MSEPKKMFINGEWVEAASGKRFETTNPATGEVLTSVPEGDQEDIDRAVRAARKAFEEGPWPKMKPAERAKLLLNLADIIESHGDTFTHLETLDSGTPIGVASYFTTLAAENIRYYAGWATKITGETVPLSIPMNLFNYTRREAIGVCGQIVPWNAPLMNAIMKLSAPLAVGNTVVLKPSELTPLSTLLLGELIQEAGFPDGVVNIVTGYGHTAGAALTEHPEVDKITFTGSTAVGKQIMRTAADHVKKVTLELGGKSANIIFADAEYEQAIATAANSIYALSGQTCFAGSRLFVEKKIYDRFMSDFADYSKNLKLGDGFDQTTVIGPLISAKQKSRVLNYLDIGQREGAEMLVGGNATEKELACGHFVKPTVMANVTNEMTIAREEIFGPVISAMPFEDIDEVIKLANQSIYGLGGGVCTTDVRKVHKVAHELKTGNVYVNVPPLSDPATPFGGFKQSGIGRENGAASIEAYTQLKSVYINLD
ncbi:aldehyde dehydrogenase family protein [Alkalihalobacillus sp. BA299]|uniref:aldehyde dehydrogenase family protein n=1 Tax=Alkalihalobacillus sp. BA299 TaxID=2815938 RepID=UPI0035AB8403